MDIQTKGYFAPVIQKQEKELEELFKGTVQDEKIKFPKELGVAHPFDFETCEKVANKISIVSGIIGKYVDHIVGEYSVKIKNQNAQKIIEKFNKNSQITVHLREWIRDGFVKGNGFLEIDLENEKVVTRNANNIYIDRDEQANVKMYNQLVGKMQPGKIKINQIPPDRMAHLKINPLPEGAYGYGIVYPNERAIETMVQHIQDHTKLLSRKAGMPMHVKIGVPGEMTNPSVVQQAKVDLQYMTNSTEWVTDSNVDMKVIDFQGINENILKGFENDLLNVMAGMECPEVLIGSGQLNEGIAKVQLEGWQRKIAAIQEQIEFLIEEKIYKPILLKNKFQLDVEFSWNLPGEEEINNRVKTITELIKSPFISLQMRAALEIELALLLNIDGLSDILTQPEKAKQANSEREEEENEIPQPEVPGAKPNAQEHLHESLSDMTVQEFVNLQEARGFSYTDYLIRILQRLNIDTFALLRALNDQEVENGLLDDTEIERLRTVLKEGFKNNKTISQIEQDIEANLDLRDRVVQDKVVVAKENRANMIARTETVRLANLGLVDLYKQNKIDQVRFLAALSDRTCPTCENLNGQVFNMNELQVGNNQPPIHPDCRCTLVGVI
jgi:SPP1 gp7 family putative phage head morphogenesis protein